MFRPISANITSRGGNLFDHRLRNVVTLLFSSKNFATLDPRSHGMFHRIFANDLSSHRSHPLLRSSTTAKLRQVGQTMIVRGSRRKSTMFRRSVQLLDAIQYLPLSCISRALLSVNFFFTLVARRNSLSLCCLLWQQREGERARKLAENGLERVQWQPKGTEPRMFPFVLVPSIFRLVLVVKAVDNGSLLNGKGERRKKKKKSHIFWWFYWRWTGVLFFAREPEVIFGKNGRSNGTASIRGSGIFLVRFDGDRRSAVNNTLPADLNGRSRETDVWKEKSKLDASWRRQTFFLFSFFFQYVYYFLNNNFNRSFISIVLHTWIVV